MEHRLVEALASPGKTQAGLARAVTGLDADKVSKIVRGERNLKADEIAPAAAYLGVRLPWLAEGTGSKADERRQVPLSGRAGAGAQVLPIDGGIIDHVDLPVDLGPEAEAVEVFGDSMWPAIHDGEILVYDRVRHDPTGIVGRKVVAKLADGRMFVKLLGKRNKDGGWTLHSFNGPPMEDVPLEWAAEIILTMRK